MRKMALTVPIDLGGSICSWRYGGNWSRIIRRTVLVSTSSWSRCIIAADVAVEAQSLASRCDHRGPPVWPWRLTGEAAIRPPPVAEARLQRAVAANVLPHAFAGGPDGCLTLECRGSHEEVAVRVGRGACDRW